MSEKLKRVAISGSTKAKSSNLALIRAIADLTADLFTITIFNGLAEPPLFNPDQDNEQVPLRVIDFRSQLPAVEGVLICTPE